MGICLQRGSSVGVLSVSSLLLLGSTVGYSLGESHCTHRIFRGILGSFSPSWHVWSLCRTRSRSCSHHCIHWFCVGLHRCCRCPLALHSLLRSVATSCI